MTSTHQGPGQYLARVREVVEEEDEVRHLSYEINSQDIINFDPLLGFLVLQYPILLLPIFEEAVLRVQMTVLNLLEKSRQNDNNAFTGLGGGSIKNHVHVRISHIPPVPEYFKPCIAGIRSNDVGRLIQVTGTGK